MTTGKQRKTKNELKAELIHGFIGRTGKDVVIPTRHNYYTGNDPLKSILRSCGYHTKPLLASDKISSIISEDGLESLFAMYDRVVSDIDALETDRSPKMAQCRKAELLYYMYSFLTTMQKPYQGISRILRASEPIGLFVMYMVSFRNRSPLSFRLDSRYELYSTSQSADSVRGDVDALEIHVGDVPNMDSASFVIRGLLTHDEDCAAFFGFRGISKKTLWVERSFDSKYDDDGYVIRNDFSRRFNPRIFLDLCYRDVNELLGEYPSLFCNCSSYAYEDMMASNSVTIRKRKMDESLVNDANSIMWSRAISLDDLLACMDDAKQGIDVNTLRAMEGLLPDKDMAFHRIMDSMLADIDEKAYDDVINSMQTLRDGCPDGIIHFTMDDLQSLMYASIAFNRYDMAGVYASLMMFLKSYGDDKDGTKRLKRTIRMNAGNMNREFLHNVRELPYEFVKEAFTITQQSLNNVSSNLEN